jgi:hypothetical protein
LIKDKVIVTNLYGEVTCADIQDAATLIPMDGLCQILRQEQVPLAYLCCEDLAPLEEGAECELLSIEYTIVLYYCSHNLYFTTTYTQKLLRQGLLLVT